jgi:hypothetical protein
MKHTKRIIGWNKRKGLLNSFDMKREVAFTMSEDFELIDTTAFAGLLLAGFHLYNKSCADEITTDHIVSYEQLKSIALRLFAGDKKAHDDLAQWIVGSFIKPDVTLEDYIDKCADQRVFNDGGVAKALTSLGAQYTSLPSMIESINGFVMSANENKSGSVDSKGKLQKQDGFDDTNDPKSKIKEMLDELKLLNA